MAIDPERQVRKALAWGADFAVDVPDPAQFRQAQDRVRSQGVTLEHRFLRRWLAPACAAVLVVGSWVAVNTLVDRPSGFHQSTGVPAVSPMPGSESRSASARARQAPGPGGLAVTDFSFVSDAEGWVIGQRACKFAQCTVVKHTVDGASSWQSTTAPDLRTGCSQTACPAPSIRFANSAIGYAYTATSFAMTVDGGRSWQRQAGSALHVEVANGIALRVAASDPCDYPCSYRLSSSSVGSSVWRQVQLPGTASRDPWWGSLLVRTGHRVVLAQLRNESGGGNLSVQATLYLSADDGAHWTVREDPCGPVHGVEADTRALASGSDGSISVLCMPRTDQHGYLLQSPDGGNDFSTDRAETPAGGQVLTLATPDVHTAVVNILRSGHTDTLYRRGPDGVWRAVVQTTNKPAVMGTDTVGMEDAAVGRWIPQDHSGLFSTTDGGLHWQASPVN